MFISPTSHVMWLDSYSVGSQSDDRQRCCSIYVYSPTHKNTRHTCTNASRTFHCPAVLSFTSSPLRVSMQTAVYAIRIMSVFPFLCPLHLSIVSKRLHILGRSLIWANHCIGLSRYTAITNLPIIAVFVEYLRQFLIDLNQIYRHSSVPKNTSPRIFPAS